MNSEYLLVGRIVGTHGIRGEVRVQSNTDFPEVRFAPGNRLILFPPGKQDPIWLMVEKSRPHKSVYLLKFQEWSSIDQAEPFKKGLLAVTRENRVPVDEEEGEYYFHQIIGLTAVTTDGKEIGEVKEILPLPANDVWVVRSAETGKEILIPYISEIVKDVDLGQKRITIEWMEGLA
ncbi:ribosome maturation factor RimM [Thermoactinomyces mirandus]|uniref:ribosome maturation factor RimM n=1 Tax=Thermoactinomyces mirandus TaxID=2756294 RepID=UPI0028B2678D|nr:ribosome maturation factor RimM [Thermoactinomyces mirandus]